MNKAQKLRHRFMEDKRTYIEFEEHLRTTEKAFDALIEIHRNHYEERQAARNTKSVVMGKLKSLRPNVRQQTDEEEFISYMSLYGGELTMACAVEDYDKSTAKRIIKRLIASGDVTTRKSKSWHTVYYKLAHKWMEQDNG